MKTDLKHNPQEQKENAKNTRNALKVLQKTATNKENLAGRILGDKDKQSSKHEHKRKHFEDKAVQTGEAVVTAADLTSDEPGADYWKKLAEKRQEMLDESFTENEKLKEMVEMLHEENRICKQMLDDSRNLVEVLQEMMEEGGADATEEATEA